MKKIKLFEQFLRETAPNDYLNENDYKSSEEIVNGLKKMAMGDLERIADYAKMILERLHNGEELSAWMYSQITLAVDQLNSVHDTMDGNDGVVEKGINESYKFITFSINDEKLDNLLHKQFSKALDYFDENGDVFYTLPTREFDRFIDAADSKGFDVDYENSENSVLNIHDQ